MLVAMADAGISRWPDQPVIEARLQDHHETPYR